MRLGFGWGLMLFATANCLSYFYWSRGWGNLLGTRDDQPVGIGFPLLIWHNGFYYPDPTLRVGYEVTNVVIALVAAAAIGCCLSRKKTLVAHSSTPSSRPQFFQFNIGELLLMTVVVAAVLAVSGKALDWGTAILKTVYLVGPLLIGWLSLLLRRLPARIGDLVTILFGLALILTAGIVSEQLSGIRDFTRSLMGVFVFWVPQLFVFTTLIVAWRSIVVGGRRLPAGSEIALEMHSTEIGEARKNLGGGGLSFHFGGRERHDGDA